ncbi:MAG: serine protease [bacterium]
MPANVFNKVAPVTVKIICENGEKEGSGSIIGITNEGRALILTACHVVTTNFEETDPDIPLEFYQNIKVKIKAEARLLQGRVIEQFIDRDNDLALITTIDPVSEKRVISYNFSRDLKPGQKVAAIGFPQTGEHTQTVGRIIRTEGNYLVFDAKIATGSSGGPLIDKYGRMIGLSKFILGYDEGYAIHMDLVSSVVNAWLQKTRLNKKWKRQKYGKFTHRFYQDPKFIVGEVVIAGALGYNFLRPTEPDLPGPPGFPDSQ